MSKEEILNVLRKLSMKCSEIEYEALIYAINLVEEQMEEQK